jgi:hypothetical protein
MRDSQLPLPPAENQTLGLASGFHFARKQMGVEALPSSAS